MALLAIRLFPEPLLRKPSLPADWKDPKIQKLIPSLIQTLYAQPGGIGIAAPQVGVGRRVIVVDVSSRDATKGRIVMLNPKIRRSEGRVVCREGCMSLPDYTGNVKRASQILVEWTDLEGGRHQMRTSGIEAICLQHEIDHLDGRLFIDRVVSLTTDVFPRQRKGKPRQR